MLSILCFFIAACQPGTAVEGLSPDDPALAPIIVSLDLRTARTHYATDEAVLIESVGQMSNGLIINAETEWLALDGGSVVEVSDGSKAMFSSTSTGTFRVVGRGKKKGHTGGGGTSEPAPVDTVALVVEPPPAPLASISVTPVADTVFRNWTQLYVASGTRSDGSPASPAVTWRATGGSVDEGGFYTAPASDGTYRVIATTMDGVMADTAMATVVIPPSNEPGGFTRIYENAFNSLPGSGNAMFGSTSSLYRGGPENMTLKSDATAPTSPSSTLQTRWPAGLEGGLSPGAFWYWDKLGDGQGTRYREVYLSFRAKIPTADFENQGVYSKLIYLGHGNGYQGNTETLALKGNGTSGALMRSMQIVFSHSQADDRTGQGSGMPRYQNVNTAPLFTAGSWHLVEVYANVGTVDHYDGIARVWVDGVLVTERKDLKFLDSRYDFTQGFYQAEWTPVWGGVGGVKTRDDFMLLDHMYVSGRQ